MGLSLSPERGHEGRIREVLQEDPCSSMYSKNIMHCHLIIRIMLLFLIPENLICNIDWCLFFIG
jgi:hypothetical protein